MKNIAFYISNHGFGHASRNIPLIRYIIQHDKDIKIFIKTGKEQGEFIKSSVSNFKNRIVYDFKELDLGLVLKKNSLEIDKIELKEKVSKYLEQWKKYEDREEVFLKENNISLVITDIVPWILNVTNKLRVKSILITNFTWVDIYREHLEQDMVNKFIEAYKKADKNYIYDLEIDSIYEYVDKYTKIGVTCREFNEEVVSQIRNSFEKKIVFITVGRSVDLKNIVDVNRLDYQFIVTKGINLVGDNVIYLDKETDNTHEYIKASDFIITKAGWGTLSEILICNKKMAILARDNVAEDREVIKKLVNKQLALRVSGELNLEEIMRELENCSRNEDIKFENDYKRIGNMLIKEVYEEL